MNIDLYELIYSGYKSCENNIPDINIKISENETNSILNILRNTNGNKSNIREKINFSEIIYNLMPIVDNKNHNISYRYEFILKNGNKNINPIEYLERYKNFDINTLPLINVAKLLGIKVEKSNILEAYGKFIPDKNKIMLGTDYPPTFIHELSHAIDHILGNTFENYYLENIKCFDELVAEASTVVICKTYNITINESYSLHYLHCFSNTYINAYDFIKRVSLIFEYVKKCIEMIKKNNGAQMG